MPGDLVPLFISGVIYLLLLSGIAHIADRGIVPARFINNPWVYSLSLGVYATSWSFYGSVGFAQSHGYQFIAIYIGATLAFLLSPLLLRPILRLTKQHQLSSLADLFAFRYRSQSAGVIVTLFILVGTLPYIALQIRAITESLHVLTQEIPHHWIALGYCLIIIYFSILFGARHISSRDKHHGLVLAIAIESIIKLLAITTVALIALFGLFGGPAELNQWLVEHPQATEALYQPIRQGPWVTLLFLAFSAAFLLPRQFHMLFFENIDPAHLKTASWAFPLFLLLFNLPIPVLLWAGEFARIGTPADYYILGVAQLSGIPWLPTLTFIGGLSAASSMIIVTTLALSTMSMNHILLPLHYPAPSINLYRWLQWGRGVLVALIILASYLFYTLLEHHQGLVQLGLISFVAVSQFVPGIVGLLFWRQATRSGFLFGLLAGIAIWVVSLILPLLTDSGLLDAASVWSGLRPPEGMEPWEFATLLSLSINGLLFVVVSMLTRQSETEREAANACCRGSLFLPQGSLSATSPEQFRLALSASIGDKTADREVQHAMEELDINNDESDPITLRRLRDRLEQNLSGLIGPQLAHIIINQQLYLDPAGRSALADSIHHMEEQLESSNTQLQGLTAELNELRRMQRQILQQLPIGVCVIDGDRNIIIWNNMMETISGTPQHVVQRNNLQQLNAPWQQLMLQLLDGSEDHRYHIPVSSQPPTWFNLHRAYYSEPYAERDHNQGNVILIENVTSLKRLESELAHNDRLASIGRLAAGIAHEIGNPITGISCLVQNLQSSAAGDAEEKSYRDILTLTERINQILQDMSHYSRSGGSANHCEAYNLYAVIEEAARLVGLTHRQRAIEFRVICPEEVPMEGDSQAITQVMINLLHNAADACEEGAIITTTVTTDRERIDITVADPGAGIPEEILDNVFEPFFTTKEVGQGTGLGLSIVHRIVKEHGGAITIHPSPQDGTTIHVTLPHTTRDRDHEPYSDH